MGYVCAWQSPSSQCLTEVQFPERVVLLLGAEKKGIPVELLAELDLVVEIPQLGVTRSLNVHVSGAILLWEYSKQQALKAKGANKATRAVEAANSS